MPTPPGGPAAVWSGRTSLLVALAVLAGYFLGAELGVVLRLPPETTSVLWPPNALLTAALLLIPPRRWWICLLAAFPAHLLVELRAGFPLVLVLALFGTNALEALLAAGAMHRWSDDPVRFDNLRRVRVFVLGVVLAANALSTFADATVVSLLRGEPYGPVWRARFLSNALAALTLVPAVVIVLRRGPRFARESSAVRRLEALALGTSFVALAGLVFGGLGHESGLVPGVPHISLVLFLPLFLWAAVRFGAAGSSLALLLVASTAIRAATLGYRPFAPLPAEESVLALQVFLLVTGVPLLFLTALIAERKQIQETLEERLRFEEYRSRLTGAFVHLASDQMEHVFTTWLRRLAALMTADQAVLLRFLPSGQSLELTSTWPGSEPGPGEPVVGRWDFAWTAQRLLEERNVVLGRIADLPVEARPEKEALEKRGLQAGLAVPLLGGGRVLGCLALVTAREREWPEAQIQQVRLTADVLAGALARKVTEDALRASETMKSAILSSLTSHVAVLDAQGRIIAVNESWSRFALDSGLAFEDTVGMGVSYLEVCRKAGERAADLGALEVLGGIQDVLQGTRAAYSHECLCPTPSGERWFLVTAVTLHRKEGGAVVSHTEVTERRRAEAEADRSREQLAHTLRVSTIGELTTSLAHELNQPLAAILANAQAAKKLLDGTARGRELAEILGDIVDEDKRAGEVIRRLRALLRKGETERLPLDLNAAIRGIEPLLRAAALEHDVALGFDLGPGLRDLHGDLIQIQQVLLNLVRNGIEATRELPRGGRHLVVRTYRESTSAIVEVTDSGPPVDDGVRARLFEPFYTTKAGGLGMGLAISRSIVEAHGGLMTATPSASGGLTVGFRIPLPGLESDLATATTDRDARGC